MKKILSIFCAFLLLLTLTFSVGCSNCSGCKKNQNLTTYNIECSLDGNLLTGKQSLDFYNDFSTAVNNLKFNLHANAFRKDAGYKPISSQYLSRAYKHGYSYGEITIDRVYYKDGDLPFSICGQDKNILQVDLPKEVFPNEWFSLTIEYKISLATVVARTGINDSAINLANFYPILCARENGDFYECLYYANGDPYFSDCANYNVTITTNSAYKVASSGKLIEQKSVGENTQSSYQLNSARSFCFVLSQNFKVLSKSVDGVEINYYYYKDETPDQNLETCLKAVKLFGEKFGKYPYPTYSVVQTEFVQGGMEFPGLVMISDTLEPSAYSEVIVHETAHQWWQSVVGNNEIENGFLDEGLAEYSVVIFYENYPEYNMKRQTIISSCEQTFRIFCSITDRLDGNVNTVMTRSLGEFASEYEYVNMAYVKPCIMYEYLRQAIGDEKFFNALNKYYNQYSFTNATPDDLVGAFEKTGADTNGFFESFFSGKVII